MSDTGQQMELPLDDDRDFFELYIKNGRREFVRHVSFLKADCLNDAEDEISSVLPDYWKTMSVRPVEVEYVWKTYEELHVSYMICKALLKLIQFNEFWGLPQGTPGTTITRLEKGERKNGQDYWN